MLRCGILTQPMTPWGQNPNTSRMPACQLPPAADIRRIGSGPLRAITGREQVHRPDVLTDPAYWTDEPIDED